LKNRTAILVLISLIDILGSSFALVNASTTQTVIIGLGKQQSVTINLQEKEIVTGSFNISASRASGNIIVNSGTVVGRGDFEFSATNQGDYVLNFKNNDNTRSRVVYLEYSVNYPSIVPQQPFEILGTDQLAIVIVLSIAVIVVIIGVTAYKQQAKRKAMNP
jgi:hypothetical protein